tara:strand:+ start:230 stop:592 length:363 start_codon:yes stop_codon:yes gene_type:complete
MKKLIWLLPVMAIFLVGCSLTPKIKTVEKVVIKKEMEKKIPLNIAAPDPLDLRDVEWIIVTRENIDEVWSEIETDNEGVALFALRHGDYEELAMNIVEIRKVLGEYVIILKQYKKYYEEK